MGIVPIALLLFIQRGGGSKKKTYSAENNGALRISFVGELDYHRAKGAIKTKEDLIDDNLSRACIIDMSELNLKDSSGIADIL